MLAVTLAAAVVNAALAGEPAWKAEIREQLGRKASFDFVETPLTEALSFFQTVTRVNMIFDPQALRGRERTAVTLKVEDMVLEEALKRVLKLPDLDYAILDDAVFVSTPERLAVASKRGQFRRMAEALAREREDPAWKAEIREQLARRVTFEFAETPLYVAISFLQTAMKVNVILDPEANEAGQRAITLRVTNMSLELALKWMVRFVELDYVLQDGSVFVSTQEKTDAELMARIEDGEPLRALGRSVSFNFVEAPFSEAMLFFQTLSKINIILDPKSLDQGEVPITLKAEDMTLEQALKETVGIAGLDYALLDEAIFISAPESLAKALAREGSRRRAESRAKDREGWDWERQVREQFRRRVSFEFVETPLSEAISFLQTLTKVNMILDPRATEGGEGIVTLRVSNMRLGTAFRWILRLADLDYTLKNGAIFLSTPAKIDAERERRAESVCRGVAQPKGALVRALERKVSFELVETPPDEAIAFLEGQTGVKMVLSPRALREGGETPVNLKVTDMSLRLALDWIVNLAGLEYSLGEDAVHILAPGEPAAPPAP